MLIYERDKSNMEYDCGFTRENKEVRIYFVRNVKPGFSVKENLINKGD